MNYKYTIITKGIFSRDYTDWAYTKEQIEAATQVEISEGVWLSVLNGKTGIVENETYIIKITKL